MEILRNLIIIQSNLLEKKYEKNILTENKDKKTNKSQTQTNIQTPTKKSTQIVNNSEKKHPIKAKPIEIVTKSK